MDANMIDYATAAVLVGAAIAMSIGTIGPAFAQGMIGTKACENVGKYPESYTKIRMTMIISMALVETCALYVLLIAFLILGKVS
jgi:F-type H+-transporting ATPase subunit c